MLELLFVAAMAIFILVTLIAICIVDHLIWIPKLTTSNFQRHRRLLTICSGMKKLFRKE